MTYNTDPIRWTESIAEAPDALRAPFAAARNEGPSDLQMKALAIKLAALSAGTAAAATAATAKAASTTAGGATVASAGSLSVAKVAISVALFGATVTGAVIWQGKAERNGMGQKPATQVAEVRHVESLEQLGEAPQAPATTYAPTVEPAAQHVSEEEAPAAVEVAQLPAGEDKALVTSPAEESSKDSRSRVSLSRRTSRARHTSSNSPAKAAPQASSENSTTVGGAAAVSGTEVDLLRRARAALGARPREAFALTQEHREKYPRGMFAQERDALAIEALMRAGEMDSARPLAEHFVRQYPSSPHAHRFRETMGLR